MQGQFIQEAITLVATQAQHAPMTDREMVDRVAAVAQGLQDLQYQASIKQKLSTTLQCDPSHAIQQDHIACCICGHVGRVITKHHLAQHDLTPDTYRQLCGYERKQPLACVEVSVQRAVAMAEKKIWEKKKEIEPESF